jgi:ATP-dependent RNA helicase SUPV3L1/SUV3
VWRPGGRGDEWRGQRRSPQRQRARQTYGGALADNATAERAVAAEGKGEPAGAASPSAANKGASHRRPHRGEFGAARDDAGERRQKDHRGDHRSERQGDRAERARGERPHFAKTRNEHKDRRDYAPHREREKQADPNSPFAKLAALKAQLEANAKERR